MKIRGKLMVIRAKQKPYFVPSYLLIITYLMMLWQMTFVITS